MGHVQTRPPFPSSAAVFAWLSGFINLGRGQSVKSFRLDRMAILSELAGSPERSAPVIHVAGSKGKGSVTGMISAMLEAAGFRCARYTSPHVSEYRERVTAGGVFFDEEVYTAAGMELWELVETLKKRTRNEFSLFNPETSGGEAPSFFELLTLYFFLCSRRAGREVMVVETGMGGRLDATNIVDPLVSVITSIELEHTEYLGNTIAAIAGEKAGIIKRGRPLVLMEQEDAALGVFEDAVTKQDAPLRYFPHHAEIRNLSFDREGTCFSLSFKDISMPPLDLRLPIPGEIQGRNAGLAILALKTAFPQVDAAAIRRGLQNFRLPARFERIRDTPPVIIDGAHTPRSVELCLRTFTALYGEEGVLIFGCAAAKDGPAMARLLALRFSWIIITAPGSFKASEPEKLHGFFQEALSGAARPRLSLIKETALAIRTALDLGRETGLPVLGTGSFYLAAEIRNVF